MDWKEMSISPREMDFLNSKYNAAREIALAFGVPPQLLGRPMHLSALTSKGAITQFLSFTAYSTPCGRLI